MILNNEIKRRLEELERQVERLDRRIDSLKFSLEHLREGVGSSMGFSTIGNGLDNLKQQIRALEDFLEVEIEHTNPMKAAKRTK